MTITSNIAVALAKTLQEDPIEYVVKSLAKHAQERLNKYGLQNVAFEISLPSADDLYFTVNDSAPGYTREEIKRVYSIKDFDTSFDGAGDLYAKSPLRYADGFLVTACRDDSWSTTFVSVDPDTFKVTPQTMVGNPSPRKDSKGLKVTVPVKPTDIDRFVDAAHKFLSEYNVTVTQNHKLIAIGTIDNDKPSI